MQPYNNSKPESGMSTTNWIALGGLCIAALTCYFSFCTDKPDSKPAAPTIIEVKPQMNQTVNVGVPASQPLAQNEKSKALPTERNVVEPTTTPVLNPAVTPNNKEEPPVRKTSIFNTSKKGDLTFVLKECKQTGQFVQCTCQVTSEEMDIDLSVYGENQTRLIDGATGKEFYPIKISIGGKKGGGAYSGTQKTIVANYPVDIVIEFGEVTTPVNIISKLEMTTNQAHTGTGSDKIEFKNIPNNQELNSIPTTPVQKQSAITTAKMDELVFQLNECRQVGQSIKCKCQVKSEEKDVEFSAMGENRTRIFDASNGKEYNTTSMNIGGKSTGGPFSGAAKTIVAGYPVDMTVEFGPVSTQIRLLSKIEMEINQAHTGTIWKKINFRNIPVR